MTFERKKNAGEISAPWTDSAASFIVELTGRIVQMLSDLPSQKGNTDLPDQDVYAPQQQQQSKRSLLFFLFFFIDHAADQWLGHIHG